MRHADGMGAATIAGSVPRTPPSATPYGRALARLARRDHSEQEIRRALRRDGFADELVEETVLRLRRERYLDDA
jgi:SOS response regulatory protein OraA/RecX